MNAFPTAHVYREPRMREGLEALCICERVVRLSVVCMIYRERYEALCISERYMRLSVYLRGI